VIAPDERPRQEVGSEQNLALVADTISGSADLMRQALTTCGVSAAPSLSPRDAETWVREHPAALLIVDVDFGGRSQGLRLVEAALRSSDASIILIGTDADVAGSAVVGSGRCHVLHRPVHGNQLRTTIRLALAQRAARTDSVFGADRRHQLEDTLHQIGALVRRCTDNAGEMAMPTAAPLPALRPRERQIMDLLLSHERVPAVARRLGISSHTVRNHLKNIYRRCGVHSQQELLTLLKGSH
jgi:DNA-binding NarL/FixJ family response regulator